MIEKYTNAAACWKKILSDPSSGPELLPLVKKFAYENEEPATVVFGTSGWRGEIGTDFTVRNIRIVTMAVIEMFKCGDSSVMQAMGVRGFEDIKTNGVIVGHDNRFLGPEFAAEVADCLQAEGIKTWYAGEAPTPEFSAAIEMTGAACSINLTPSHNPSNYAGFKFNPSDGGPAGSEITSKIEEFANNMMSNPPFKAVIHHSSLERLDTAELYLRYISERGTIDLQLVRNFIDSGDCFICIDNVHGSTRGRLQKILGISPKVAYLRTETDYLFGGVAPEPSEINMAGVDSLLKDRNEPFRLGVIMDPDGDRIRFSDGSKQIPMNYFGAMALHFLTVYKGIKGIAAKSVGTSNFVNAVAGRLGIPVKETKVGFKNFRPYLLRTSSERAVVAFEESDGISGYNNTLEKDAIFGLLLALEMTARLKKNLSEYLSDIMNEFGAYYPDRAGITVDPTLIGEPLLNKLSVLRQWYAKGTEVQIGGRKLIVMDLITVDGTKVVFDDCSWLMIRPSGTEPKVRFYIEARTEEGKKEIFEFAEKITKKALGE